jgi:hypothetical protein
MSEQIHTQLAAMPVEQRISSLLAACLESENGRPLDAILLAIALIPMLAKRLTTYDKWLLALSLRRTSRKILRTLLH